MINIIINTNTTIVVKNADRCCFFCRFYYVHLNSTRRCAFVLSALPPRRLQRSSNTRISLCSKGLEGGDPNLNWTSL